MKDATKIRKLREALRNCVRLLDYFKNGTCVANYAKDVLEQTKTTKEKE